MKKHDKTVLTFTKKWVNRLMWLFAIWITLTYVLAFMDREDIAEALSQDVMTGGVAVFLVYMLKAFFETYSEENLKYKKMCVKSEKADDRTNEDSTVDVEEDGKE